MKVSYKITWLVSRAGNCVTRFVFIVKDLIHGCGGFYHVRYRMSTSTNLQFPGGAEFSSAPLGNIFRESHLCTPILSHVRPYFCYGPFHSNLSFERL